MKDIKLAILNIKMNFRNEKELKSSFIITIIGMAINNIAFLILWYYFGKSVGTLNGWEPIDVFGLYGFSTTSYGIVVSLFSRIYDLPMFISSGTFDKFLSTPKNILLKVSTSKIRVSALGDLLFGIICFIIFTFYSKLTYAQILLSLFLIIIASIIYYSFSLICHSVSFYLMDGENISSSLYELFLNNSLYHGGAYTGLLRIIFTFVMPSLLIGAIPVETVKNFSLISIVMMILLTIFWFVLSIMFFYKSLKRYESNNFFGFGS